MAKYTHENLKEMLRGAEKKSIKTLWKGHIEKMGELLEYVGETSKLDQDLQKNLEFLNLTNVSVYVEFFGVFKNYKTIPVEDIPKVMKILKKLRSDFYYGFKQPLSSLLTYSLKRNKEILIDQSINKILEFLEEIKGVGKFENRGVMPQLKKIIEH